MTNGSANCGQNIKKSIEYAWHPENLDLWDPDRSGVLTGRQHHTLDMELFGPNAWLTSFYLGALEAGARMANHLGEEATAVRFREILNKGKTWADAHLFNGEYYHQNVNLTDPSLLKQFARPQEDEDYISAMYWAEDLGELKYQLGEGCNIDQVLGQWHADLYGLGDLLDRETGEYGLSLPVSSQFSRGYARVAQPLPHIQFE